MTRNEYMNAIARAEKKAQFLGELYEIYFCNKFYDPFDAQTGIILKNIERFVDEIIRTLSEDDSYAIIHEYLFAYEWDLNH